MNNHNDGARIAYLCAQGRSNNPAIAALRLARATLSKCSSRGTLPVNIEELCDLRKVVPIEMHLTGLAGRLLPVGDHYIAEINARNPETRRRFTLGHELGHTFFQELTQTGESGAECVKSSYADMLEERLCDIFSAEFLMPEALFRRVAADHPPGLESVRRIAETFGVSMLAATRQIIALDLWPVTILLFNGKGRRGLNFRSCSSSKSVRFRRLPISFVASALAQQTGPCGRIETSDRMEFSLEYYTCGGSPHGYVCSFLFFK
jgi:hypothetical protein